MAIVPRFSIRLARRRVRDMPLRLPERARAANGAALFFLSTGKIP
jgi:hypothetical protein